MKKIDLVSDVSRLLSPVIYNRAMFGVIISIIVDSLVPEDPKLLLS